MSQLVVGFFLSFCSDHWPLRFHDTQSSGCVFGILRMLKLMNCKWGGVWLKVSSLVLILNVQLRVEVTVTLDTKCVFCEYFPLSFERPGRHAKCSAVSCCNGTRSCCFTCGLSQGNVLLVFILANLFQICHLWFALCIVRNPIDIFFWLTHVFCVLFFNYFELL